MKRHIKLLRTVERNYNSTRQNDGIYIKQNMSYMLEKVKQIEIQMYRSIYART